MKIIDTASATATLAEYTADIADGPVIVTNEGLPVAVLIQIENADVETISLSTNREFIELIEKSRARVRAKGGISSDEMRRRFESK